MRALIATLALGLACAVSGCASMSENECQLADWRAVGYEDGAQGYPASHVGERRAACARHNVRIDFDAYLAGREQGLVAFCQPQRGFDLGARGGAYAGVCPARLESAFLEQHRLGLRLYKLDRAARDAHAVLVRAEGRLEALETRIVDAEVSAVVDDLPIEERAARVVEIHTLMEERGGLRETIPELEHAHAEAVAELEAYEQWLDHERMLRVASVR